MAGTSQKKGLLAVALALVLAVGMTFWNILPARSQVVTLVASQTKEAVPLDDPYAPIWQQAAPLDVLLTAQKVALPWGGGSIRSVRARALQDGKRLYLLLEWDDATQNQDVGATELFRDAAAVQFPVTAGGTPPFFCMGQVGNAVNIWHWKADWQATVDKEPSQREKPQVNYYPPEGEEAFLTGRAVGNPFSQASYATPVENLAAGGFGTLTTSATQSVAGKGVWKDGRWRVLFARDFATSGTDDAQFREGETTVIAFAVWDGEQKERDGIKSVSQFVNLELAGPAAPVASPTPAQPAAAAQAPQPTGLDWRFGVLGGGILLFFAVAAVMIWVGSSERWGKEA